LLDIVPIKNEKSEVVLYLASHKDITHTKMAELQICELYDSGESGISGVCILLVLAPSCTECTVDTFPASSPRNIFNNIPSMYWTLITSQHGAQENIWDARDRKWNHLCRLVVRVPGYRSRGPGFGFGTGSTQPREYNWGVAWKK
jgi:hypothetical protein